MQQNAMKTVAAAMFVISCTDTRVDETESQTIEVADISRIDQVASAHTQLFAAYRDIPTQDVKTEYTRLA